MVFDVYVAGFESPYIGNTMHITEIVNQLDADFTSDEIFDKHQEVVFVCHSLGD